MLEPREKIVFRAAADNGARRRALEWLGMLLEGIFAAVTTPFYPDERIYFRKLEANMAHYSRSLLAGIVVLGSTGEAPMLDDAESAEVLKIAAEAAAPEKVLIAGVSRESVKGTLAMAETAALRRYDAVLVRSSSYYLGQMTQGAVLNYFRAVADSSPLPVVLYNIPQCVPCEISIAAAAELAQHPNIIGIKDSSGSMERIRGLVNATADAPRRTVKVTPVFEAVTERMMTAKPEPDASFVPALELAGGRAAAVATPAAAPAPTAALKTRTKEVGFQVLCGSGTTVLESLKAGASGSILGFAACAPQACQEIYLAWKDHDQKLAEEKQQRILAANREIVAALGIAGIKYACDFNGYYGGRARRPLLPLAAEQRAQVERILAGIRN